MRCTKDGKLGNPFEFKCDECKCGMSIMNAHGLDPKDRQVFEAWLKRNQN